jgi:hypothetical protein
LFSLVLDLQSVDVMLKLCLLLAGLQADPQEQAPPPQAAPAVETPFLPSLHGSLALRYRSRATDGVRDNDLYQYLQLRWADPGKDVVSASLSARFAQDLDRPEEGYHPFASLDATYEHSYTARLYTAYVDLRPEGWNLLFRGGRQVLDEIPEMIPIDGGLLRTSAIDVLDLAVFAGVPVNLFESSPHGDLAYGGWAGATPWARGRVRVEYVHVDDENVFGAFDDDLVGASFEQAVGAFLIAARHTWLEGDGREAWLRGSGAFQEIGLAVDLRGRFAYDRQPAQAYPLDPYATFLFDVQPHMDLSARVSQAIGRHVSLDAGVQDRRFIRDGEEGTYNHEFTRWTLAPRLDAWPWEFLSLSGSFDYWNSTADDFWTAGGDATVRAHPRVALGIGTTYALYVIDTLSGDERDHVRAYYGTVRWTLADGSRVDLRYTYEENDLGNWSVLDVGVRHDF